MWSKLWVSIGKVLVGWMARKMKIDTKVIHFVAKKERESYTYWACSDSLNTYDAGQEKKYV